MIFLCEQLFHLQNASFYMELEFVHLVVFGVAMMIILQAVYLLRIRKIVVNYWELVDPADIPDVESIRGLLAQNARVGKKRINLQTHILKDKISFILFKELMQNAHENHIGPDFDMVRYLDLTFVMEIIELMEIKTRTWCLFIVAFLVNYGVVSIFDDAAHVEHRRLAATGGPDGRGDFWLTYYIILGWVCVPVTLGLIWVTQSYIPTSILRDPLCPWAQSGKPLADTSLRNLAAALTTVEGRLAAVYEGGIAHQVSKRMKMQQVQRIQQQKLETKMTGGGGGGNIAHAHEGPLHGFLSRIEMVEECIGCLLLFTNFYIVVAVLYYMSAAPWVDLLLMLIPVFITLYYLFPILVKAFVFVKVLCHLDVEVVQQMLEDEFDTECAKKKVSDELIVFCESRTIDQNGVPFTLRMVFAEWDVDQSGTLCRAQLHAGLTSIGIALIKKVQNGSICRVFVHASSPRAEGGREPTGRERPVIRTTTAPSRAISFTLTSHVPIYCCRS